MNEQMSYVARFYSFGSLFLVEQKDQELFTPVFISPGIRAP